MLEVWLHFSSENNRHCAFCLTHRFQLIKEEIIPLQLFPGCPHLALCCENCGNNSSFRTRMTCPLIRCCSHNTAPSHSLASGLWDGIGWSFCWEQHGTHTAPGLWRAYAHICPGVEWVYKGFWTPKEKMYTINQWWCINRLLPYPLFTECNSLMMAFCTVYHRKTIAISPQ